MSNIILIIAIMHTKNAHKSHEWNSNTREINDNNKKTVSLHTHAENVANLKPIWRKKKKLDKKYNIFFARIEMLQIRFRLFGDFCCFV